MAKKKEDKELKVGDIVKVNVMKYKNFRGTITEIVNGIAKVVVQCYYNDQQNIVVYQDIRFLKRAEKEREY